MRLSMPITSRKVRNHLHYSLWKYLLLVVLAMFGWNLIYTVTRYRVPENLQVEFYAEGNTLASDQLQVLADIIHRDALPKMEAVTATVVTFDDTYGDMQLTTWVSAGQGDVYMVSKARFETMAGNEATLNLQPYVDNGLLHTDGIPLTGGVVTNADTGKTALMGIPADSLTGLEAYGLTPKGMVLCVLANNGNDENSIRFLDYLLTHMVATPSSGGAEATANPNAAESAEPCMTPIPSAAAETPAAASPVPSASAAAGTESGAPAETPSVP